MQIYLQNGFVTGQTGQPSVQSQPYRTDTVGVYMSGVRLMAHERSS